MSVMGRGSSSQVIFGPASSLPRSYRAESIHRSLSDDGTFNCHLVAFDIASTSTARANILSVVVLYNQVVARAKFDSV